MLRRLLPILAVAALALGAPSAASAAADYVPGEVIVHYKDGTSAAVQSKVEQRADVDPERWVPGGAQQAAIDDGTPVARKVAELEADPAVSYAVPNFVAHASTLVPNDPGFRQQWDLAGPFSINMPDAWDLARVRRAPGGKGAVVAVLDTGVAYERRGRFRRAPDLNRFVGGFDFVDGDRHANDQNGHGTHVAGTIAESTNNRAGAAGIAYGAKIMPIRVLNRDGAGDTVSIARGIRFAAKRKVDVINLSLEFDASVRASQIPDIVSALHYARKRGVVVVAAAGNQGDSIVAYPARAQYVVAVAATTVRGCQADYSNSGVDIDIAAPGGGSDAANTDTAYDAAVCRPEERGRFIFQQTFTRNVRTFGLPQGYEGTSMAAPHVSGIAALIMATRRLGKRRPPPAAVEKQLEITARDIGRPGFDSRYGAGLVDGAAALR